MLQNKTIKLSQKKIIFTAPVQGVHWLKKAQSPAPVGLDLLYWMFEILERFFLGAKYAFDVIEGSVDGYDEESCPNYPEENCPSSCHIKHRYGENTNGCELMTKRHFVATYNDLFVDISQREEVAEGERQKHGKEQKR